MPYRDPDKQREYSAQYQRERRAADPEYAERRRQQHNRWATCHPEQLQISRREGKRRARVDPAKLAKIQEQQRRSYLAHRDDRLAYAKRLREDPERRSALLERARQRHAKARDAAILAYGGYMCACCGETRPPFLALDHTNGGGNQQRKVHGVGIQFYRWLARNGFPAGFRVLCHNCNYALGQFGYCPHQEHPAAGPVGS